MIFVARYNDGSCGIADAENEEHARKLLQSEEMRFDPDQDRIISLRRLSASFASRWFFEDQDSEDLVGCLTPKRIGAGNGARRATS